MPKPYIPNDRWAQKARSEGYLARSVYKLMELDERFGLLKPGMKVLDIGAAPGSWLQYTSRKIGPSGKVLGIDLQAIAPLAENVHTAVCDINDASKINACIAHAGIERFDVILSDIAPSTSGVKDVDQWRSIELSQLVLKVAQDYGKPRCRLVMKVFRGSDFDEFLREVKAQFHVVKTVSVKASRDRSREVYLVCWQ